MDIACVSVFGDGDVGGEGGGESTAVECCADYCCGFDGPGTWVDACAVHLCCLSVEADSA